MVLSLVMMLACILATLLTQIGANAFVGNYSVNTFLGSGYDTRPSSLPSGLKTKGLASISESPFMLDDARLVSGSGTFSIQNNTPADPNGTSGMSPTKSVVYNRTFDVKAGQTVSVGATYTLQWSNKGYDSNGYPINVQLQDTIVSVTNFSPDDNSNMKICAAYSTEGGLDSAGNISKNIFMIGEGYQSACTVTSSGNFVGSPEIFVKHRLTLKLVRTNGSTASGKYLFAMKDLDIFYNRYDWWKKNGQTGPDLPNVAIGQSDRDEMCTLVSGFDSDTYIPSSNSYIDQTSARNGKFRPSGSVMTRNPDFGYTSSGGVALEGTKNDNFTNGFLAVGSASGMTFEMQGAACATGLFTDLGYGWLKTDTKTTGGSISPDTSSMKEISTWGTTPYIWATANTGYKISKLQINGANISAAVGKTSYSYLMPPTEIGQTQEAYVWFEPAIYQIHFEPNTNGGAYTGSMSDMTNLTYGNSYNLTKNAFDRSKDGYEFTGWSTSPSGSGYSYTDQQNVPINSTFVNRADADGTLTLYAQWKLAWVPGIKVVKTAKVQGHENDSTYKPKVGDVIKWAATVTNSGNVTLTNVKLTDAKLGITDLVVSQSLAANASVSKDLGTHTVTQGDVDTGHVPNSVSATGTPPNNMTPPSDTSDVDTPTDSTSKITIVKSYTLDDADGDGKADYDDTIRWKVTVTNAGTTTLSNVSVTDPFLNMTGGSAHSIGTMTPGQSVDVDLGSTKVTLDQAKSGKLTNTATVTGKDPQNKDVTASSTKEVPTDVPAPKYTIKKHVSFHEGSDKDKDGSAVPTDVLDYTADVENTGNVDLKNIVINDQLLNVTNKKAVEELPIGRKVTITLGSYTVTKDDMAAGKVVNTVTSTGETTIPNLPIPNDPHSDTVQTPVSQLHASIQIVKSMTITKDVNGNKKADYGDDLQYHFAVTNTGNVELSDVTVSDDRLGIKDLAVGHLDVNETKNVDAPSTYKVTADDANAGSITNTATTKGTPPYDLGKVTDDDKLTTPIEPPLPNLAIKKEVTTDVSKGLGRDDTVEYKLTVTNTGNVDLAPVTVTDDLLGVKDEKIADKLTPGESASVNKTHTITQAEADAGKVLNTATAHGTPPEGIKPPSDPKDDANVPIKGRPSIAVEKSWNLVDDKDGDKKADYGDTVGFTIKVTNTGDVTLTNVTVDDDMLGIKGQKVADELAPGKSVEVPNVPTHFVTAEEAKTGNIVNTAHASGKPKNGEPDVENQDDVTVPLEQPNAQFIIEKSFEFADGSDSDGDGKAEPGDVINYTIKVTNTGNVTLKNVTVTDEKLSIKDQKVADELPQGQSAYARGSYTATVEDMELDSIDNVATTHAESPDPAIELKDPPEASVSTPVNPRRAITLEKDADKQNISPAYVNDEVIFTFKVRNTGNTLVKDVYIDDPMIAKAIKSGHAERLMPFDASDKNDGDDTDDRGNENTSSNENENENATETTKADASDTNENGNESADGSGDTNQGEDTNGSGATGTTTVPAPEKGDILLDKTELMPGEVATGRVRYLITQDDIDNAGVRNVAIAHGTSPDGQTKLEYQDDAEVGLGQAGELTIEKSVDKTDIKDAKEGDALTYTFVMKNTSNVTLRNISPIDRLDGMSDITWGTVEGDGVEDTKPPLTVPDASDDANEDDGTNGNENANGNGNANTSDGDTVEPQAVAETDGNATDAGNRDGGITDADGNENEDNSSGNGSADDAVDGNENANGSDDVTENASQRPNTTSGRQFKAGEALAPGQTVTGTATYRVRQSDIDAGHVENVISVSYQLPDDTSKETQESRVNTTLAAPEPEEQVVADDVAADLLAQTGDGMSTLLAMSGVLAGAGAMVMMRHRK